MFTTCIHTSSQELLDVLTMQVISVGTLTQILVNNLPHPLSPFLSNVEFWWSKAHLYKKNYLPTFVNIVLGGGGGLHSNCTLKNNCSSTKWFFGDFLDSFHKCPNSFWPLLSKGDYVKEIMFVVYFCMKKGVLWELFSLKK